MTLRGPIVCATDLTVGADAALSQAHGLATALGTELVVCHVLPEAFSVRVLFPQNAGTDLEFDADLARKAELAVRQRLDAVIGAQHGPVSVAIETGSAHAGIVQVAERIRAGLIVIGAGAAAQRVARLAGGPVLVARPSPLGGSVLGATDFSDPSLPAVKTAASEARRRGTPLRVVHCLDIDETAFLGSAMLPGAVEPWGILPETLDALEATARERLTKALSDADVAAEPIVLRRGAALGILEAAAAVATSLIVVGTRGRTGLARLALGSVAEAVMHRATCSVLVVPLHHE